MPNLNSAEIAKIAHNANVAYCKVIGDVSPLTVEWDDPSLPEELKASVINGVENILKNPHITPEDSHKNWLAFKEKEGWKYGEKKDFAAKTHPCFVPYDALPETQRKKDDLFSAIVRTFIQEPFVQHGMLPESEAEKPIHHQSIPDNLTVCFDFDGVIHGYSHGWQDGTIYDKPILETLVLMADLFSRGVGVFILSTREPEQIIDWFQNGNVWETTGEAGFTLKIIPEGQKFWNRSENAVGVTNKKRPALVYIDDRAIKFSPNLSVEEILSFRTWQEQGVEKEE